ncbi:MAG: hypothetical protein ABJO72_08190 [Hyphomicrobiales bacterium]
MLVLAVTLSLIWMLLFWRVTRYPSQSWGKFLFGVAACFIAVILSSPELWQSFYNADRYDGFYDLSTMGRAGVILISTASIILFFVLLVFKTRWILQHTQSNLTARIFALIADCIISLALFGFLFSLTPQLYYTLYQFVFDGLPNQVVIKSVFNWEKLLTIAQLKADDSFSHQLSGIALLAIIPFTTWLHGMHRIWQKESIALTIVAVLTLQYATIF